MLLGATPEQNYVYSCIYYPLYSYTDNGLKAWITNLDFRSMIGYALLVQIGGVGVTILVTLVYSRLGITVLTTKVWLGRAQEYKRLEKHSSC